MQRFEKAHRMSVEDQLKILTSRSECPQLTRSPSYSACSSPWHVTSPVSGDRGKSSGRISIAAPPQTGVHAPSANASENAFQRGSERCGTALVAEPPIRPQHSVAWLVVQHQFWVCAVTPQPTPHLRSVHPLAAHPPPPAPAAVPPALADLAAAVAVVAAGSQRHGRRVPAHLSALLPRCRAGAQRHLALASMLLPYHHRTSAGSR